MAHICHIIALDDERIKVYARLTEAQLRNELHPEDGVFIAESPKVIRVAMEAGYRAESLLCEERHIEGDAKDIIARCGDIDVYTGTRELLAQLTGYTLTRGVLAAMKRPQLPTPEQVCSNARRLCIIQGVCDATNTGDPLNRRSVRVSMGSVFLVPWTWVDSSEEVRAFGFKTVAMALTDMSIPLDAPVLQQEERLALVMGTEGDGLPREVIEGADYTVRIPMHHGVDSLNVAAASAVAFWELRKR